MIRTYQVTVDVTVRAQSPEAAFDCVYEWAERQTSTHNGSEITGVETYNGTTIEDITSDEDDAEYRMLQQADDDNDPFCVCGTARSEHALCGCGDWERAYT